MFNEIDIKWLQRVGKYHPDNPFKIPDNFRFIRDLKYHIYKYKPLHDEYFEKLKASIKQSGMINPITIDKNNYVLDGFFRVKALQAVGYTICLVRITNNEMS